MVISVIFYYVAIDNATARCVRDRNKNFMVENSMFVFFGQVKALGSYPTQTNKSPRIFNLGWAFNYSLCYCNLTPLRIPKAV